MIAQVSSFRLYHMLEQCRWQVEARVAHLRQQWKDLEGRMLDQLEHMFHWQAHEGEYNDALQSYYLQRAKHQAEMVRLNQVLYGQRCAAQQQHPCQQAGPTAMALSPPTRLPLRQRASNTGHASAMDCDTGPPSKKRGYEASAWQASTTKRHHH